MPLRIGTCRPSCTKVLVTPSIATSVPIAASLVAQLVDRPQPAPEQRWVDGDDQTDRDGGDAGEHELCGVEVHGQAVDIVHLGVHAYSEVLGGEAGHVAQEQSERGAE